MEADPEAYARQQEARRKLEDAPPGTVPSPPPKVQQKEILKAKG